MHSEMRDVYLCAGTDDEPDDGPQHYILLLGFYQPELLSALGAIGVYVANVIQLCSEQPHTDEGSLAHQTPDSSQEQTASPVLDEGTVYNTSIYCSCTWNPY